jgi:hypothetical protein
MGESFREVLALLVSTTAEMRPAFPLQSPGENEKTLLLSPRRLDARRLSDYTRVGIRIVRGLRSAVIEGTIPSAVILGPEQIRCAQVSNSREI